MPTVIDKKLLGQRLPAASGTATIYQVPDTNVVTEVETILISNQDGSSRTFSIYMNSFNSDTFGAAQALYASQAVSANVTEKITFDPPIYMNRNGAALAVSTDGTSNVNFQVFGKEIIDT